MSKKNVFFDVGVYVTGKTKELNKTEMVAKLDMAGAYQSHTVNKKTRYLIIGDENISQISYKAAKEFGSEIITFKEAIALMPKR